MHKEYGSRSRWGYGVACAAALATVLDVGSTNAWPVPQVAHAAALSAAPSADADRALIEAQPVCIASKSWSAGELADTVVYHYRRVGERLHVGYFALWSTERPWGPGAAYLAGPPALLTDAFYSHFLFVFPGVQRLMYGPGDVEGARIEYEVTSDGRLVPLGGIADDAFHAGVALDQSDLQDAAGRVVLMTEAWSHQLGSKGAAQSSERAGATKKCFVGASLRPMTREIADAYRMGDAARPRRARPAWKLPSSEPAPMLATQVAVRDR